MLPCNACELGGEAGTPPLSPKYSPSLQGCCKATCRRQIVSTRRLTLLEAAKLKIAAPAAGGTQKACCKVLDMPACSKVESIKPAKARGKVQLTLRFAHNINIGIKHWQHMHLAFNLHKRQMCKQQDSRGWDAHTNENADTLRLCRDPVQAPVVQKLPKGLRGQPLPTSWAERGQIWLWLRKLYPKRPFGK